MASRACQCKAAVPPSNVAGPVSVCGLRECAEHMSKDLTSWPCWHCGMVVGLALLRILMGQFTAQDREMHDRGVVYKFTSRAVRGDLGGYRKASGSLVSQFCTKKKS